MKKLGCFLQLIFSSFIIACVISGCNFNPSENQDSGNNQLYEVSGNVGLTTKGIYRSAYPDFDSINSVDYEVVAESLTGTQYQAEVIGATYKVFLPEGIYTFTLKGFDSSSQLILYSEKKNVEVTSVLELNLTAEPQKTENTTGWVNIPMEVDADSGIFSGLATWTDLEGIERTQSFSFTNSTSPAYSDTFTLIYDGSSENSVPAGTYSVRFVFFDSNLNQVFGFTETVVVYTNLITSKWLNVSPYNSGDKIHITKNTKNLSSICVDSVNGSDTNCGDFFSPLKSIDAAINLLSVYELTEAKIYLMADCEWTQTESINIPSTVSELTVSAYGGEFSVVTGEDAHKPVIKQAHTLTSSLIKTTASTDLTLKNIVLEGTGYDSTSTAYGQNDLVVGAGGGGGIYSKGGLILENCTVQKFYAYGENTQTVSEGYGGGISFANADKSVLLKNTRICKNKASFFGGGIMVLKGTLYCDGAEFLENEVTSTENPYGGAAIYIYMGSKLKPVENAKKTLIDSNSAHFGPALIATGESQVDLEGFIITNNITRKTTLGTITISGAIVNITDTIISGNSGGNGVIYLQNNAKVTLGTEDNTKPVLIGTNETYTKKNAGAGIRADAEYDLTLYGDVTITGNQGSGVYLNSSSSTGTSTATCMNLKGAKIYGNGTNYSIESNGYSNINFYDASGVGSGNGNYILKDDSCVFTLKDTIPARADKVDILLERDFSYSITTKIFTNSTSYLSGINNAFAIINKINAIPWTIDENTGLLSCIYMGTTNFYVSNLGSDSNPGTLVAPMKTLEKTISIISLVNDGTSSYTVTLMNDLNYDISNKPVAANTGVFDIMPSKKLNLNIKSYNANARTVIDGGGVDNMCLFNVIGSSSNTVTLTLENIQITNCGSCEYGSAISAKYAVINLNGSTLIGRDDFTYTKGVYKEQSVASSAKCGNDISRGFGKLINLFGNSLLNMNDTSSISGNYGGYILYLRNSKINVGSGKSNSLASIKSNYSEIHIDSTSVMTVYGSIYNNCDNGTHGFISSEGTLNLLYDGAGIYDNKAEEGFGIIFVTGDSAVLNIHDAYLNNVSGCYDILYVDATSSIELRGSALNLRNTDSICCITDTVPFITIADVLDYTKYNSSNPIIIKISASSLIPGTTVLKGRSAMHSLSQLDCKAFVFQDDSGNLYNVKYDTATGTGVIASQGEEYIGEIKHSIYDNIDLVYDTETISGVIGAAASARTIDIMAITSDDAKNIGKDCTWNVQVMQFNNGAYSDITSLALESGSYDSAGQVYELIFKDGIPSTEKIYIKVGITYQGNQYSDTFAVKIDS